MRALQTGAGIAVILAGYMLAVWTPTYPILCPFSLVILVGALVAFEYWSDKNAIP